MTEPIVYKPAKRKREKRVSRGFSIGELRAAGLSISDARRLGIYVDKRRKSVHEWNVKALKEMIMNE